MVRDSTMNPHGHISEQIRIENVSIICSEQILDM